MDVFPFSALLNWTITAKCNLKCIYCSAEELLFNENPLQKVDIDAVMENLDKQNKTFIIIFTGGEPLLLPNMVEVMQKLSTRHYIGLNTNLVSPKARQIAEEVDPRKISFINASLHIDELEKHQLFDRYLSNFLRFKELGVCIFPSVVGHPTYSSKIRKYKKVFNKYGITFSGNPFQGEYANKKYPQAYTRRELKRFNIQDEGNNKIDRSLRKGKLCSAGYNFGFINEFGEVYPCYRIYKRLGNIYKGFNFNDFALKCPAEYCPCPNVAYYPNLLEQVHQKKPPVLDQFEVQSTNKMEQKIFTYKEGALVPAKDLPGE